jgi:hypothetical protein
MHPDTLKAEMKADPKAFLRHYYVEIHGNRPYSGTTLAWVEDTNQTQAGFTTGRAGRKGRTKQRPRLRFIIGDNHPGGTAHQTPIPVHYVAMRQVQDALHVSQHTLPTQMGNGPDIMLTSQMSACSFAVGSDAQGAQYVAHIQGPPDPHHPGRSDYNVSNATATSGMPVVQGLLSRALQIGAPHTAYTDLATVIGIRKAGAWRFYVQRRGLAAGATDVSIWDVERFA